MRSCKEQVASESEEKRKMPILNNGQKEKYYKRKEKEMKGKEKEMSSRQKKIKRRENTASRVSIILNMKDKSKHFTNQCHSQ